VPIFATNSERGPGVSASLRNIALVAIPLLAMTWASRAYANPPDTPASVRATATEEVPPLQAEVRGPTAVIKMSDDNPMYQPNSILIRAGQTVEWLNTGQVSHSVVDDPAKALKTDDVSLPAGVPSFASGNVMPGGKYRHTFLTPGRYRYFCMSHEVDSMVGEIIVQPPTPDEAARVASQLKSQPWRAADRPEREDESAR
jgi:plastocyanin